MELSSLFCKLFPPEISRLKEPSSPRRNLNGEENMGCPYTSLVAPVSYNDGAWRAMLAYSILALLITVNTTFVN